MGTFDKVDSMTSRDFHGDFRAHVDTQGDYLKDYAVMNFFKELIFLNKHLFRDKIVLNLSCGIGILSLFAAKAGAKCVFATDKSNAIEYAERIVRDNKMDGTIKVMRGSVEEIQLPVDKVDIILSDWMGFSLIFEAQCRDVIYARDKWLKQDGLIIPDLANLFVRGFEDGTARTERIDWWNIVYGFKMDVVKPSVLAEPLFRRLQKNYVLTSACSVHTINLKTASYEDICFRNKFFVKVDQMGYLDGLYTYFHVKFSQSHVEIRLNTDHNCESTRWMQCMFFFDKRIRARRGDVFYGGIEMSRKGSLKNDLKQIGIRMEVYSGEEDSMNLEVEGSWLYKSNEYVEEEEENEANCLSEMLENVKTDPLVLVPGNNEHLEKNCQQHNDVHMDEPPPSDNNNKPKKTKESNDHKIIIGDEEYPIKMMKRKKQHKKTKSYF